MATMIDCIIERHQAEPSLEHIIPAAIGGRLTTRKVCTKCNNDHCSKLDVALTDTRLMIMARHQYQIPGYDVGDRVFGTGTLDDGTVVNVRFDKTLGIFVPVVRGGKTKTEKGDGTAQIAWTLSPDAKPEDLISAARKELEKHGEMGLTDDEVLAKMTFQQKTIEHPKVNISFATDLNGLTLSGLKIAYEYTVEMLGYDYLKDAVADQARDLIIAGIPDTTGSGSVFSCPIGSLTFGGKGTHSSKHKMALFRQGSSLVVGMSLFDTFVGQYTMTTNADAYLPFECAAHEIDVTTGQRTDARIPPV